jgi:hypothetical protein
VNDPTSNWALDDAVSRILGLWESAYPGDLGEERYERRRMRGGFAWEDVRRYRSFVMFALDDRAVSGGRFVASVEDHHELMFHGEGERTHAELYDERMALMLRAQYPLECFYLFGKILLDRIAVALVATFGEAQKFKPSHGGIVSERHGLAAFAQAHHLAPPPATLVKQAQDLEDTLTRFRDREITHAQIYSGRGVMYSPSSGEVEAARRRRLDADETSGPLAHQIADTLPMLDMYLAGITGWVEQCLADVAGRLGAE